MACIRDYHIDVSDRRPDIKDIKTVKTENAKQTKTNCLRKTLCARCWVTWSPHRTMTSFLDAACYLAMLSKFHASFVLFCFVLCACCACNVSLYLCFCFSFHFSFTLFHLRDSFGLGLVTRINPAPASYSFVSVNQERVILSMRAGMWKRAESAFLRVCYTALWCRMSSSLQKRFVFCVWCVFGLRDVWGWWQIK